MEWFDEFTPLIRQVQDQLRSHAATVATAESCTGGLLATLLTELPGSSALYLGGVSAYANEAKVSLLGVDRTLIERCGAVSGEVAEAMALGVKRRLGSTYALSLTGIAGPDGGTKEKPVGTVFCGFASPAGVRAIQLSLTGDRSTIRRAAADGALRLLWSEINN